MANIASRLKEAAPMADVIAGIKLAVGEEAKFSLVELNPGGFKPVYDGMGELLKFANGADAAIYAEALSRKNGSKYQPRVIVAGDWMDREERRMKSEYTLLPWHKDRWWVDLKHIWGNHYPHVSISRGASIAFTESPEKGAIDVQTPMKPGRYLTEYFGKRGILSDYVIRDLCTEFSAKFEDNLLLWAETEEEIVETYITGPSSCMSKPVDQFMSKGKHPVSAYATPDFKVAYMMRDGRVVARTVVHVPNKCYSTIYGDAGRLRPLLEKEGYRQGWPYGGRLKKMVVWEGKKGQGNFAYVTPHLDGVGWLEDKGDPEYLYVGSAEPSSKNIDFRIDAGGARGITELLTMGCGECSENKQVIALRNMINVFSGMDSTKHTPICKKCAEKKAVQCCASGYWVMNAVAEEIAPNPQRKERRFVWKKLYEEHTHKCDHDGKIYLKNEIRVGPDKRRVSIHNWNKIYIQCYNCGTNHVKGEECGYCSKIKKKPTTAR